MEKSYGSWSRENRRRLRDLTDFVGICKILVDVI